MSEPKRFEQVTMEVFTHQYTANKVYRQYCDLMGRSPENVHTIPDIPFLPVSFFKTHDVICGEKTGTELVFTSSGTSKEQTSRHIVRDPSLYEMSFRTSFELFYGDPKQYTIIGLLPSYLERKGSSLIYMMKQLMEDSGDLLSGFVLHDHWHLNNIIQETTAKSRKLFLLGVTYALLDLSEKNIILPAGAVIVETGGMKGKRKEMVREEVHGILEQAFNVNSIHSEYGMTELLSQAWSTGKGIFNCPSWMKILIRDAEDPLSYASKGSSGGINVIDLANLNSCSFIATDDLGKLQADGSFEVLGRFDHADVRGCNLMV